MTVEFNAIYVETDNPDIIAGAVLEYPGVVAQGRTVEEVHAQLRISLAALIESRRTRTRETLAGSKIIQESQISIDL